MDDLALDPQVTEQEDGGVLVDFEPPVAPQMEVDDSTNLAELLDDDVLMKIGGMVVDLTDADIKSNTEWVAIWQRAIDLLGLRPEDKQEPFPGACGLYDPILLDSVIRAQALMKSELLPPQGPVRTEIYGIVTPETEQRSKRKEQFMNYYLTKEAHEYYEDTDQMLFYLPIVGSTFKKVFKDPYLSRPSSQFILPNKLVVNYSTTDIDTALRVSEIVTVVKRDLKILQMKGVYRDVDLGEPDEMPDEEQEKLDQKVGLLPSYETAASDTYTLIEQHTYLDIKGFEHLDPDGEPTGITLPYIVTVDRDSKKVLSIYKNGSVADPLKKKQYYVHFKMFPGLGFYGAGYAHFLGGSAETRTKIIRQLIDSGTFANLQAGFKKKGARVAENDYTFKPGEWKDVDGVEKVSDAFATLPYREPSQMLFTLYESVGAKAEKLSNTAIMDIQKNSPNIPVGTVMALMEESLRVPNGTLERCHKSMTRELGMIAFEIGDWLPENSQYPFPLPGAEGFVMKQDFMQNNDVVPVSDLTALTGTQRLIKAESVAKIVKELPPQLTDNQREAARFLLERMGIDNPDKFLPPPPPQVEPLDPVTENANAMMGKPVKAGLDQNHQAHLEVHKPFADNPAMGAHIQEHLAMAYLVQAQQMMGMQIPQGKLPPEIENQIAMKAAQATQQYQQQQQPKLDPMQVAMAEVQSRERIAQQKLAAQKEQDVLKASMQDKDIQADIIKADIKSDDSAADRANSLMIERLRVAPKLNPLTMENDNGY